MADRVFKYLYCSAFKFGDEGVCGAKVDSEVDEIHRLYSTTTIAF
jgi:hypothetical protein